MKKPQKISFFERKKSYLGTIGFIIYFLSFPFFLIFLTWLFVPDYYLDQLGIIYRPEKQWGINIIIMIIISFISLQIFHFGYILFNTLTIDEFKLNNDIK